MIQVVTRQYTDDDGELVEEADEWAGPKATFTTEPSGVLVILQDPSQVWAAYAAGAWVKVREID